MVSSASLELTYRHKGTGKENHGQGSDDLHRDAVPSGIECDVAGVFGVGDGDARVPLGNHIIHHPHLCFDPVNQLHDLFMTLDRKRQGQIQSMTDPVGGIVSYYGTALWEVRSPQGRKLRLFSHEK